MESGHASSMLAYMPQACMLLEVNRLILLYSLSSQIDTTGTSFYLTGKTGVKGDTAGDISKPSIFLCRHRNISTSESRQ